jgi:hypothetical protein
MRQHTKVYLDWAKENGMEPWETRCEITGKYSGQGMVNDIHHRKDNGARINEIEYLMMATREAHLYFGESGHDDWLIEVHESYMRTLEPWIETNPDCEILQAFLKTLI